MIVHPNAAMGAGNPHWFTLRCAVNIDHPSQCIDLSSPVEPRLLTGQPEDTGQNPVTLRLLLLQLRGVDLSSGSAPDKDRILGTPFTNLDSDMVPSPGGAATAQPLTRTVEGSGDRVAPHLAPPLLQAELLPREGDTNQHTG